MDTHAHIFQRGLKLAPVHRYTPDYDATLDDYLAQLDRHGISHGVLIQPSFLGTDNSYLAAGLRRQRDRLRGVAVVEPDATGSELDALAADGIVGIRLNLVGEPIPDFGTETWKRHLRDVAARSWHVQAHREARDLRLIIDPLLAAGLRVVVDHFGRPDPKLGVDDPGFQYLLSTGPTRKVWVKLSGAYRNGANGVGKAIALAAVPLLRKAFGADRLLWGSDWPHTQFEHVTSYDAAVSDFRAWIPDPAERDAILRETPRKLYRF